MMAGKSPLHSVCMFNVQNMGQQWIILGFLVFFSGQFGFVSTRNVCKTFGSGVLQTFNATMFHVKSTCPIIFTHFSHAGVECFISVQRDKSGFMKKVEILVNKITTIIQDGILTVEGNSISLPYDHTYQSVYTFGIYTRLTSKVLPLSVTWYSLPEGVTSLWVHLNRPLVDGMTGMCGRINSSETRAQLLGSNVIRDEICVTSDSQPVVDKTCSAFKSYARDCLGKRLYIFDQLCKLNMYTYVHASVKCSFYEEFIHPCNNSYTLQSKLRNITSCKEHQCPGALQYKDWGASFPPTCSNPELQTEFHSATCLPPTGLVLNDRVEGYHSVKVENCPCVHRGNIYDPGQNRSSKCQSCECIKGKWSCSLNTCVTPCVIEGWFATTFDGKQYSLPGKCAYVAAMGLNWTVTIKFSDMTIKEIHLDVYQEQYIFSLNSVQLREKTITATDLSQTDHVTVYWQSSMFVKVQTSFGMKMQVQVSPEVQLYMYLPQNVTTAGLCGSNNNNTEDDFTTSSGIVENSAQLFALSWAIGDCTSSVLSACINTDNEIFAEDKCSQLTNTSGVFALCHDYVPVHSYFSACVQKTCQATSHLLEHACIGLGYYAKACTSQGIIIGDWRAETGCTYSCDGNLRFDYAMQACNRTCRSLSGPDLTCDMLDDPVEGCGCESGTHLNTQFKCSPRALCECTYPSGTTPPGPVVIDGRQCICENGILQCSDACDCPYGQICVHCAQALVSTMQMTCASLSKPSSSYESCISGCYCPKGRFADHNGRCVTQENCTCEFSGMVYASGESVESNCKTCSCRGGQWNCVGDPCPGLCEVFGNGQYKTFDSNWYRFDGHCQYILVEDISGLFSISAESVPCCDEALTCSRSISVKLKDEGTLILSDMNVTQKLLTGWQFRAQSLYSVHTVGLYIIISVPQLGLNVIWDKQTKVKIELQAYWNGKVRGLCGDFDGKLMNDQLTSSSTVVVSTLEFGNSWKAAVPPCSDVTEELFPCERHSYCAAWAQRRCMILHSDTFKACHLKVDPSPYYQACVLESCSCDFEGKFLGFCTAVAAYADACTNQNVCIKWRTPDLCPVYCDYYNEEGQYSWHYEACPHQIKTCGKNHQFSGKLEGCYPQCPTEMPYYDENRRICSSLDRCTCYFNNTVLEPGANVTTPSECCDCIKGQMICYGCFREVTTVPNTTTPLTTTNTPISSLTPTMLDIQTGKIPTSATQGHQVSNYTSTTPGTITTKTTKEPTTISPIITITEVSTEEPTYTTSLITTTTETPITKTTTPEFTTEEPTSLTPLTTTTTESPKTTTKISTSEITTEEPTSTTQPTTTETPKTTTPSTPEFTTEETTSTAPLSTATTWTPTTTTTLTPEFTTEEPSSSTPLITNTTGTPITTTKTSTPEITMEEPTSKTPLSTTTTRTPITTTTEFTTEEPTSSTQLITNTKETPTTTIKTSTPQITTEEPTSKTPLSTTTTRTQITTTTEFTTEEPTSSTQLITNTKETLITTTKTSIPEITTEEPTSKTQLTTTRTPITTTTTTSEFTTEEPTSSTQLITNTKETLITTTKTSTPEITMEEPTSKTPLSTTTTRTPITTTTEFTTEEPTSSTQLITNTKETLITTTRTSTPEITMEEPTSKTPLSTTTTRTQITTTTEFTTEEPTSSTQLITNTKETPTTTIKTSTPQITTEEPTSTTTLTTTTTETPITTTTTTPEFTTEEPTSTTTLTTTTTETPITTTTTTTEFTTEEPTSSTQLITNTKETPTTTIKTSTPEITTEEPTSSTQLITNTKETPTTTEFTTEEPTSSTQLITNTKETPTTTIKTSTPEITTEEPTSSTQLITNTKETPTTTEFTTEEPTSSTQLITNTKETPTTTIKTSTPEITTEEPTSTTTLTKTTTMRPITTTTKTPEFTTEEPTSSTQLITNTNETLITTTTTSTPEFTSEDSTSTTTLTTTASDTLITTTKTTLPEFTTEKPTSTTQLTTTETPITTKSTPEITSEVSITMPTAIVTRPVTRITTLTTEITSEKYKTTSPSPTTVKTSVTATTISTSTTAHNTACKDLNRNQTWPEGLEWTEDCFTKICKSGVIELRPLICPTLVIPVCPRGMPKRIKDKQGCCDTWQCDCQCDVFGDPHYTSFAGQDFVFLENCTYILVEEMTPIHQLSISVDNYDCEPSASCAKGIIVQYQNNTVKLQVLEVPNDMPILQTTLNQVTIKPPYQAHGLRFENTDAEVYLFIEEIRSYVFLSVWNTLQISLAMENFFNNTQGQCGVCGGPSCTRRDGVIETEDCCDKTAYEWIEDDPLKPYCQKARQHVPCYLDQNGTTTTTISSATSTTSCAAPLCDLLRHSVFRECSGETDVEKLVSNCKFDYCVAQKNSSVCSPLERLADQCKKMGICVAWRSLSQGICDIACPEGMIFEECRNTSTDFCQGGVHVLGTALDTMRSGCFCPDKQLLAGTHKKICVSECTNCKGPLGEPMSVGAIWESNCHICTCNNQTLTEECWPKPPLPTPTCSSDSALILDCCNNQICVERTCEYNGRTYKVGETWSDPKSPCLTHHCTSEGTEIERRVCPQQSCPEELQVWDEHHCCYLCNTTCRVKLSKMTVENCTQEVMLPTCEGNCASGLVWVRSGKDLQLEHNQFSCREKDFDIRQISLVCNGATATQYTYKHITSCECQREICSHAATASL